MAMSKFVWRSAQLGRKGKPTSTTSQARAKQSRRLHLRGRLAQEGLEVLYIPVDEYVVQELKEVNGKTFKSTTNAGLDLGDENC